MWNCSEGSAFLSQRKTNSCIYQGYGSYIQGIFHICRQSENYRGGVGVYLFWPKSWLFELWGRCCYFFDNWGFFLKKGGKGEENWKLQLSLRKLWEKFLKWTVWLSLFVACPKYKDSLGAVKNFNCYFLTAVKCKQASKPKLSRAVSWNSTRVPYWLCCAPLHFLFMQCLW